MSHDYRGFRIKQIHVICGIGDDDEEGVPTFVSPLGPIPLIAADDRRLGLIMVMAQRIADANGKDYTIAKFSIREDVGEIKSKRRKN